MATGPTTVVTFSGGMDSTTLLYDLRDQGHEVLAISVDYGQRHRVELECSRQIAEHLGIAYELADLRAISSLLKGSSLTEVSSPIPLGHYADESMKQTVVPNRNMLLLAVATAWAINRKADQVAYAAHAGDHTIYPDCRPEFADVMAKAIGLADWHKVELIRPFVHMTKAQIAARGHRLGVPYELTWSCYQGRNVHCGACGTCIERREAFLLAEVPDPTHYDDNAPALRRAGGHFEIDWAHTIDGRSGSPLLHDRMD
jgi:7-cyano-7-deazaguanine synthase